MSDEIRQRLIHVELKVDQVLAGLEQCGSTGARAHPDQPFGNVSHAQYGEDLMLLNLFHMLGIEKPGYIDLGAHHPLHISNTALLYQRGCRGINVEANPNLIAAFHRQRPEDINLNVGVGPEPGEMAFYYIDDWSGRNTFSRDAAEAFVRRNPSFRISKIETRPIVTLNQIVAEHAGGVFPELLSIDVEGMDFDILDSADFSSSRPLAICVEAITGGDTDGSVPLARLMRDRGYVMFGRTVGNLIFAQHGAARALGIAS